MTTRRLFLKGIGIALTAPAIVKAENLMKIVVPKRLSIRDQVLDLDIASLYSDIWTSMPSPYEDGIILPQHYFDAMQRRLYRNARVGARMAPPADMPTSMDALLQQMKQDRLIIKEFRKQQFNLQ